ncbi:MAG: hypothetical protein WBE98_07615 [Gammaproteobacteria bacterium]|nr:hypothetical protein [Gammaproteobacteria bacterium]
MRPRQPPPTSPRTARKHDPTTLPLDRALHEVHAIIAASQRLGPGYGCVEWYFYDDRKEPQRRVQ